MVELQTGASALRQLPLAVRAGTLPRTPWPRIGLWAATAILLLAPLLCLLVATWRPEWDPAMMAVELHFWVVSGASLMAGGLAAVVIAAARSLRQSQTLFVALGFLALAVIFSAHGLTTWPGRYEPTHQAATSAALDIAATVADDYGYGYGLDSYGSYGTSVARSTGPDGSGTAVSAWLSLAAAALFVGLGSLPGSARQRAFLRRHGHQIFLAVLVLAVAYTAATILRDGMWAWVPWQNPTFRLVMTMASVGLLLAAAYRYGRVWWLVGLRVHGSMAVALLLLAEAQLIMTTREPWHLSWWIYHALLLVAFGLLFISWALEARRAGSLAVIAEGLALQGTLSSLVPASVDGAAHLLDALEVKDPATSGHVFRVAHYAVAIARELGLQPEQVARVALAGKLHDIGKIGTPDHILQKPAKLTPEEYRIVQEHTPRGHRMASRVALLRQARQIIRGHHERLDGTGYPDGLRGEEIPIEARAIAVADAFDAMTSQRPYRRAMSRPAALQELHRVAGSQLDPQCLAAFERALVGLLPERPVGPRDPERMAHQAAIWGR